MNDVTIARSIAWGRIGFGLLMLLAPNSVLARTATERPGPLVWMARAFGIRDLVLGAGAVLVWDPIGGPVGVSVAESLAAAGRTVHLATQDHIVGNELSRSGDLAPANARLQQAGVQLHRRVLLKKATARGAELEGRFDGTRTTLTVGTVVDAGHRLPEETLWEQVASLPEVRGVRAGDTVAPRTVLEAVREGRRAAVELG